jgi:hypothetical protein
MIHKISWNADAIHRTFPENTFKRLAMVKHKMWIR